MDYERAKAALRNLLQHETFAGEITGSEDLISIVELFAPYPGDDAEEARKRNGAPFHCKNCKYQFDALFHPSRMDRAIKATFRLSQCPRCFSTDIMVGGARSEFERKVYRVVYFAETGWMDGGGRGVWESTQTSGRFADELSAWEHLKHHPDVIPAMHRHEYRHKEPFGMVRVRRCEEPV